MFVPNYDDEVDNIYDCDDVYDDEDGVSEDKSIDYLSVYKCVIIDLKTIA